MYPADHGARYRSLLSEPLLLGNYLCRCTCFLDAWGSNPVPTVLLWVCRGVTRPSHAGVVAHLVIQTALGFTVAETAYLVTRQSLLNSISPNGETLRLRLRRQESAAHWIVKERVT